MFSDDSRPAVDAVDSPFTASNHPEVNTLCGLSRAGRMTGVTLIAGLFFLRFGYDFGVSDQDEFLPYLLHLLRPDLLLGDWFVAIQTADFGIRTPFVYVLYGPALLFSIKTAVLLVYVLSFYLIVSSVLDLVHQIIRNVWLSWIAAILILVATHHWQPGGNEILNRMLVPSMLAWGLALKSVVLFGKRRIVYSVTGLAMATWIHPLVGIQTTFLLLATVLITGGLPLETRHIGKGVSKSLWRATSRRQASWRPSSWRPSSWPPTSWRQASSIQTPKFRAAWTRVRSVFWPAVFYAVLVAPLFWILFTQQSADQAEMESAYQILTRIRSPHHYVPSYFPVITWIRFSLVVACAVLVGVWQAAGNADSPDAAYSGRSFRMMISLSAICLAVLLVAVTGSLLVPSPLIVKLQLFKTGIVLKSVSIVVVITGMIPFLPVRFRDWLDRTKPDTWISSAFTSVLLILTIVIATSDLTVGQRMAPGRSPSRRATDEMLQWIRKESPESALFLVPPEMTGFRFGAERAIFVNFKAVPYAPQDLIEWYRRMRILSANAPVEPGGTAYLRAAKTRFQERSSESMTQLMTVTHTTFLVRNSNFSSGSPQLRPVFSNSSWSIFKLEDAIE